jgi:hypothetical protein
MKSQFWGTVLLGVALLAGRAQASIITINFDTLPDLTVVTNQYTDVVFSSSGGDVILTYAQNPPYLGSIPNVICSGATGAPPAIDCMQDVILSFSVPVASVTFSAFGNATTPGQSFATADIYQNNSVTPTQIVPLDVIHTQHNPGGICGTSADCQPDIETLTFPNITKLDITANTDPNGTAYDDFSIDTGSASAPEPSTLFLTGLCGIALVGRRYLARRRG